MRVTQGTLVLLISLLSLFSAIANAEKKLGELAVIDLRDKTWGEGEHHVLDSSWQAYWNQLLTPETLDLAVAEPISFPVPGVWSTNDLSSIQLPALGYMTYRAKVLVPQNLEPLYLYIPDMPSAYQMWINGEKLAQNGKVGPTPSQEQPGFIPKTITLNQHKGELDILLQVSNYHYREGGIWFSLKLTDESGRFALKERPVIFAVFAGAVLIALGIYNCLFYVYRKQELAAFYFGLLCLIVGVRRLLIDERVFYLFDIGSWATLQRIEHLCFYLSLPLFIGFFTALFPKSCRYPIAKSSWVLIAPFIFICLAFPARVYTELNIAFQMLVLIGVTAIVVMFVNEFKQQGKKVYGFGASLLVLFLTVLNDILKANDIIDTPNIAHFGVFAFIVSQSISFQRRYLKSLTLVETMSDELSERNEELIKMDSFKDEFLANTSHELRTPLHGIAGLAKALTQDDLSKLSPDQRNKIELIASTSRRLGSLVNDILDLSSIKHNKLNLNRVQVDLHQLITVVISTLRPVIGEKQVLLTCEVDPDARFINADEFRLQQVIFNVVGNALKYTEQGSVVVRTRLAGQKLVIEIVDTGVGIPDLKMSSLFKPFEQAHEAGELSAGGSGLGLSISKQLVELHGGQLEIESAYIDDAPQDHGTCVKILLPQESVIHQPVMVNQSPSDAIKPLPHYEIAKESVNQGSNDMDGPLIYIVDDELVNRELLSTQLKSEGYQFEAFADGMSLMSRLNECVPDLILLDLMMPKMNGLEVCELVRGQYDAYELPIMMLTARQQVSDIVKALGVGANDYLVKPYSELELLARVRSQLDVRRYWIANRENQKLKNEIVRREQLEEELSELNSQLLNVLDISEDLILLVNDEQRIIYSNQRCEHLFRTSATEGYGSLLGKAVHDFFDAETISLLDDALALSTPDHLTGEVQLAGISTSWQINIKRYQDQQHSYLAIVLSTISKHSDKDQSAAHAMVDLTKELGESRRKINQIESALRQLNSLSLVNPDPENEPTDQTDALAASKNMPAGVNKELIASLHKTTLNLWERYTSRSKAELAETSRCWRVYIDGTTVKTRTFDKYLSAKTIPDKPRWRAVVRTGNFVLSYCELNEADRNDLQRQCEAVEDLFT